VSLGTLQWSHVPLVVMSLTHGLVISHFCEACGPVSGHLNGYDIQHFVWYCSSSVSIWKLCLTHGIASTWIVYNKTMKRGLTTIKRGIHTNLALIDFHCLFYCVCWVWRTGTKTMRKVQISKSWGMRNMWKGQEERSKSFNCCMGIWDPSTFYSMSQVLSHWNCIPQPFFMTSLQGRLCMVSTQMSECFKKSPFPLE
jgi:hypothetical protein